MLCTVPSCTPGCVPRCPPGPPAPLPAWPSRPAGSPAVVPDTGTICMGPAVVEVLVAVLFSGGMSGSFP